MPTALRVALAIILGFVVGSGVNIALVLLGPALIAPPAGADMTTAEGLKAAMPLLEPKHFLMPFLAHALGTLAGALAAAVIGASHRKIAAYVVGTLFLCGGIAASFMIPAPAWFKVLDIAVAYLPMAWLALSLADHLKPATAA